MIELINRQTGLPMLVNPVEIATCVELEEAGARYTQLIIRHVQVGDNPLGYHVVETVEEIGRMLSQANS